MVSLENTFQARQLDWLVSFQKLPPVLLFFLPEIRGKLWSCSPQTQARRGFWILLDLSRQHHFPDIPFFFFLLWLCIFAVESLIKKSLLRLYLFHNHYSSGYFLLYIHFADFFSSLIMKLLCLFLLFPRFSEPFYWLFRTWSKYSLASLIGFYVCITGMIP